MSQIALILDLDNTLYSWIDAFAPALQSEIKYVSEKTKVSMETVQESFKKVFLKHQTVEVFDSVKELDIWKSIAISSQEKQMIQKEAQVLFLNEFKLNLKLYEDVKDVLNWAQKQKYYIIAFSDARAYWVNFRLKALKIENYFDGIYVLEDDEKLRSKAKYPNTLIEYPIEKSKPKTDILYEIINTYKLSAANVYLVGDNKRKDIIPAQKAGINNLWAKYGKMYKPKNKKLMCAITPWTASQRAGGGNIKPKYVIEDFSEVKSIIESARRTKNV